MNCPTCNARYGVEIVMHADGYAKNLLECASCGSIWASMFDEVNLLLKKLDRSPL